VTGLREIASSQGLPQGFLAKIFPKFVQHGLVRVYRGSTRGYALAKAPEEIRLREILEAVEGPHVTNQCFFWGRECDVTNPCPMHCQWREIRPWIGEILERTTLKELILKDQMVRELCEKGPVTAIGPAGRGKAPGDASG
jgi:Rrf2 family protein